MKQQRKSARRHWHSKMAEEKLLQRSDVRRVLNNIICKRSDLTNDQKAALIDNMLFVEMRSMSKEEIEETLSDCSNFNCNHKEHTTA